MAGKMKNAWAITIIVICIIMGIVIYTTFNKSFTKKSQENNGSVGTIGDFDNHKIYTQLDVKTIASIPDNELEITIMEHVSTRFNKNWTNEYEVVSAMSPGIRAVYSTMVVESEVDNGGFNQFYWNSSNLFAKEAVEDFERLGAKPFAELMKEANAIRESEKARMQEFKKEDTMEAFSESYKYTKLNELDEKFYKLNENEILSKLRIKYIREHPEEFVLEGKAGK